MCRTRTKVGVALYIVICYLQVHGFGDEGNSAERPSCWHDDDVFFSKDDGAIQVPKLSTSTDIVNSIKNRFYQTVQSLPSLEIPGELDSQVRLAQWLSQLPYQALTPMVYSKPCRSPLGELSPATNVFNFHLPVPASAECDVGEELLGKQNSLGKSGEHCPEIPVKDDHPDERKEEIFGRLYVVDDSITPKHRQRAYALCGSRTPRK